MKTIKVNWGACIAAMYCAFVLMIVALVVMSTRQKIDLVTSDYYEEELVFQDKIARKQRAAALSEPVAWQVDGQGLKVYFPETCPDQSLGGTISLYCPADDRLDRTFEIHAQNGIQVIDTKDIAPARYMLHIDWKDGETTYWNEGVIRINQP